MRKFQKNDLKKGGREMSETENYDILVIGSGVAGKLLSWTLAKAGQRTAMVERKLIGGACPNIACLPSKNMIYSAKVNSLARRGAEFGLETGPIATNMKAVQRRKRLMVDGLIQMHLNQYKTSGAELIMGEAHFIGARTVEISLNSGGVRRIAGDRVFLDLGTHAALPDWPGLAAVQPMTHVEALDLDRLPEHLIVLGGGFVGLELAQAMRRFGSRVTVIEIGPQLISQEDPDVGGALLELFHDEGIDVMLETQVSRVEGHSGRNLRVHTQSKKGESVIEGTDILVAVGRSPNTHGIGLKQASVEVDEHGYIKVNERLETTAPKVWAMGECAGSPKFTHVSFDDFRIVNANLNGGNRTTKNRLVPFCMFTDPLLERVGLNESEAKSRGIGYRLVKMPMAEILKTWTLSEPRGFLKMLIGAQSDEILGFSAFGVEGSELMGIVQTAMIGHLPYTTLDEGIFTHPTVAEGLSELLASVPAVV
jgi:pyruvate/2-oxoglutarate dehydrogenase complex dihydrolipoamide dehydrogenase (E3) component